MSPSTYHIKRKYLEDLGWITVLNRGFKETCLVSVKVGSNDPEYEHMSWAKWHPDNENQEKQLAEQEFRTAAQKVFVDDDLFTGLLDSTSKRQDSTIDWDDSEEVA